MLYVIPVDSLRYLEEIPVCVRSLLHVSTITLVRHSQRCSVITNFSLMHLIELKIHVFIGEACLSLYSFEI